MKHYFSYGNSRTDFRTLAEWLIERQEFKNSGDTFRGRVRGNFLGGLGGGLGQLPALEQEIFKRSRNADTLVYVVYSYGTPIAWLDSEHGWYQPDTKYSNTTTRHQSAISVAISVMEDEN